jgi:serine/threonine protein kinase
MQAGIHSQYSSQIGGVSTPQVMPEKLTKLEPAQQELKISQKGIEVLENSKAPEPKGLENHNFSAVATQSPLLNRVEQAAHFQKGSAISSPVATPSPMVPSKKTHQPSLFESRLRAALEAEVKAASATQSFSPLPEKTEKDMKRAIARVVRDLDVNPKAYQTFLAKEIESRYLGIKNGTQSAPLQEKEKENPHTFIIHSSIDELRKNYGGVFQGPDEHSYMLLPLTCNGKDGTELFPAEESPMILGEGSFSKVVNVLDLHTMEVKAFGIFKTPEAVSPEKALSDAQRQLKIREGLEKQRAPDDPAFPFLLMEGAFSFISSDGTQEVAKMMELGSLSLDKCGDTFREPDAKEALLNVMEDMFTSMVKFQEGGYLHLDLKLENFMMTNAGCKLADFDSATSPKDLIKNIMSTGTFQMFGTPTYMRPGLIVAMEKFKKGQEFSEKAHVLLEDKPGEAMKFQQKGLVLQNQAAREAASLKNDRWGLGVCLYELMTGEFPPFIQGRMDTILAQYNTKADDITAQWQDPLDQEGLDAALSQNHYEMQHTLLQDIGTISDAEVVEFFSAAAEGSVTKVIGKLMTDSPATMRELQGEFMESKNNLLQ